MTEFLDFTEAGRKKSAPPPPPTPPKKAKKSVPRWKSKIVIGAAVILTIVIVVLAVRAQDDTGARTTAANLSRYCQLNTQFDSAASNTGAWSRPGSFDGPPGAMVQFLDQSRPVVVEMKSLAPAKIRSDLQTVVSGVEQAAAGDLAGVESPSFAAAYQRLQAFQASCSTGGASGDG